MAEWIVRVEAVNFGATIFDTNDLSTMRGGSLAALDVSNVAIDALREIDPTPRPVYAGASQCAFCISAGSEEAATRAAVVRAFETRVRSDPGAPHAHMVHVIDIAPAAGPDDAAALQTAEARNRTRQFREWTQAPIALSVAARDADRLDRVRPATDRAYFPKDPVLVSGDPEGQTGARGAEQRDVSPSVKARRQFGRDARQRFYGKILGDRLHPKLAGTPPDLHFAHDFQDIVASPPHEAGLSVRNKIAVVYADGNGFGDARGKVGTVAFATQLAELRKGLLKAVIDWLATGACNDRWQDVFAIEGEHRGKPVRGLRFETILWGGDELVFVMPAWLATAFVEGFFRHTAGWAIDNPKTGERYPLTHAVGVAVGHVKVPVRQMRGIAESAANAAKEAGLRNANTATFEIFESLHPPDENLARWRKSVFGTAVDDRELARKLALPGDGDAFAKVLRQLEVIVWGIDDDDGYRPPFPRSQIYAALRQLRDQNKGVAEPGADAVVDAAIEAYAGRAGMDKGLSGRGLKLPTAGGGDRGLAMDIALLATLWDYANPFTAEFPRFAPRAGAPT